jgi:hypothetical protein
MGPTSTIALRECAERTLRGKNEFDGRLGNFRARIYRDDEEEQVAPITVFRNTNGPAEFHPRWTFRRPRQMHCILSCA